MHGTGTIRILYSIKYQLHDTWRAKPAIPQLKYILGSPGEKWSFRESTNLWDPVKLRVKRECVIQSRDTRCHILVVTIVTYNVKQSHVKQSRPYLIYFSSIATLSRNGTKSPDIDRCFLVHRIWEAHKSLNCGETSIGLKYPGEPCDGR